MFTLTQDLQAEFPALAARQLGWLEVPAAVRLRAVRTGILAAMHSNLAALETRPKPQSEIQHVYLHGAKKLRPDLSSFRLSTLTNWNNGSVITCARSNAWLSV